MLSERLTRFNTQPPKGGWLPQYIACASQLFVSTHSRLKAAGRITSLSITCKPCFNTQPPKGGWAFIVSIRLFQLVSTHSRLKAAGLRRLNIPDKAVVSTHSRLKAAG